jgi:hypothetical protein
VIIGDRLRDAAPGREMPKREPVGTLLPDDPKCRFKKLTSSLRPR